MTLHFLNDVANIAESTQKSKNYNVFNDYCRELAPGTVSLTGDRVQGDDSKQCAYSTS